MQVDKSKIDMCKVRKFLLCIILWLIVIAIVIPFLCAASQAVFKADDFTYYWDYLSADGNNRFTKSIGSSMRFWKVWQGSWFSTFMFGMTNSVGNMDYGVLGISLGLTIIMVIGALCFYTFVLCKEFDMKSQRIMFPLVVLLFLASITFFRDYTEVYLWWTTTCVYLIPMGMLILGLAFFRLGCLKRRKRYFVVSSICLFLMGGGVLANVGWGCFTVLILTVSDLLNQRKVNKGAIITFAISVIGALLNAAAPGNFARYHAEGMVTRPNYMLALKNAVFCSIKETEWLLYETWFLVFILIAFLVGNFVRKKIEKKDIILGGIYMVIAPIVAFFPVALGIGSESVEGLANRILFITDASLIHGILLFAVLFGAYVFQHSREVSFKRTALTVMMGIIIVVSCQRVSYQNCIPVKIAHNYQYGILQEYSSVFKGIYEEIQTSPLDNVVLEREIPMVRNGIDITVISEETDDWVNRAISRVFGKDSVSLIRKY